MEAARTDKELLEATRPFATESAVRSWWSLLSTAGVLVMALVLTAQANHGLAKGALSVFAGLVVVRMFILYHDFLHGALLRNSKAAKCILYPFGIYVLTPPGVWRETHNYHHAHTAKIVGSHVGSYAMVTPQIWAKMKPRDRTMYRLIRHPLTILMGFFTIFMYGMCVSPLLRAPRKHWDCGLALVVTWSVSIGLVATLGWSFWFFVYFLPLAVAMASGAYLFYAQHNFPDVHVQPRESWSYVRAALESSSYMKMGPVMRWFTGNIGYHHVHHLNQLIPFYRLPEAMAAIPELQTPPVTTLSPKDIAENFRLKLWDPELGRMVGFPSS
jgi:omega-6 fatty acid desaturase (delta-12 desaturase)